jgi:hypothetical protein
MTRADFRRGPESYRRAAPTKAPRKTFLIVTEGKQTEPNYLRALCRKLSLSTAEVVVHHPEATDPKSLTDEAIELSKARRRMAKKSYVVPYDEVWVVYDLEKPHDERRQLHKNQQGKQKAHGVCVASSDPCFEFWLLLHFQYTTRPFADYNQVVKSLKKHLLNYEKASEIQDSVLCRTPDAVKNAEKCRSHHKDCGGDGNPSTDVHLLVRSLNDAASDAFRFVF